MLGKLARAERRDPGGRRPQFRSLQCRYQRHRDGWRAVLRDGVVLAHADGPYCLAPFHKGMLDQPPHQRECSMVIGVSAETRVETATSKGVTDAREPGC